MTLHATRTAAAGAGETPLTCAAYCGHYDAVKALVEEGQADVNLTRQDGTTPLNLAAYADARTALLLLNHGARPDANTSKASPFPVPLVMSAARGDMELCARLIEVRGGGGGGWLACCRQGWMRCAVNSGCTA
jgi:ankyrin repeat protein